MRNYFMYENYHEKTVLKTIHGSHLYGLAHDNSDTDYYEIFIGGTDHMKRYAEQHIDSNGIDKLVIHLDRFLTTAASGAPQALEALWSTQAEISDEYAAMLQNFRPDFYETRDRYRRTILNFAFNHGGRSATRAQRDNHNDHYKLARHALRLTLNLNDFIRFGKFNPELSPHQAEYISELAMINATPLFRRRLESLLEGAINGELRSF